MLLARCVAHDMPSTLATHSIQKGQEIFKNLERTWEIIEDSRKKRESERETELMSPKGLKKQQQIIEVQKKKIIDKLCGSNIKTDLKKDEVAILTINFSQQNLEEIEVIQEVISTEIFKLNQIKKWTTNKKI